MNITKVNIRNFRRLENVAIGVEIGDTVFVGPNNSGKTSATDAFRVFLGHMEFTIHDFSVSRIADLDAYGFAEDDEDLGLPSIGMDLWFSVDPQVEYGRVASLLPEASSALDEVGMRLEFNAKDASKLKADYLSASPPPGDGSVRKSLSHYLSLEGNLKRHFGLTYLALENRGEETVAFGLDPDEGKRVLAALLRVDFVDAQRNLHDQEGGRSNRLSAAFETFYRKNLVQAEVSEEANRVIDENNEKLTDHYSVIFGPLMKVLENLGVPSANDRQLIIESSLTPEAALRGGVTLLYVDPDFRHELPEAYNGLGFKNLIYMAIQVSHFHLQWMRTEDRRPLCQIIFIEEPEIHLHPQVQQAFVANIWGIVEKAAKEAGESHMVPQIVITTHSSHILDTVDFEKVRYFKRCVLAHEEPTKVIVHNASRVLSLRDFKPGDVCVDGEVETEAETIRFLRRYLKLTHCDLFFADAAVLVEGTAEKLLLASMAVKCAPELRSKYITTLEVGGAYAHRFAGLLKFLGIPYLVITDLDSVLPTGHHRTCRADTDGAVTSNAALKFFVQESEVCKLGGLDPASQCVAEGSGFIAFQRPTDVSDGRTKKVMHGRTFEETFVYQNMQLFRDGEIRLGTDFPESKALEDEYQAVYSWVNSSSFKKTEFALDVAFSTANWVTPSYIESGLCWLNERTRVAVRDKTTADETK